MIVRVEVQEGFYDVNCFPRSPLNLWTFMIFFLSQVQGVPASSPLKNYDELLWPQNAFLQLILKQKPRLTFFSQAQIIHAELIQIIFGTFSFSGFAKWQLDFTPIPSWGLQSRSPCADLSMHCGKYLWKNPIKRCSCPSRYSQNLFLFGGKFFVATFFCWCP